MYFSSSFTEILQEKVVDGQSRDSGDSDQTGRLHGEHRIQQPSGFVGRHQAIRESVLQILYRAESAEQLQNGQARKHGVALPRRP